MRVCLFEDSGALGLEPITWTRPVFSLICGSTTLADKQLARFSASSASALVRPKLAGPLKERGGLMVNDAAWLSGGPTVLVNARWLPPPGPSSGFDRATVGLCNGEVAFAVPPPEALAGLDGPINDEVLDRWRESVPTHDAGGRMISRLWELVDLNGEMIQRDVQMSAPMPPWRGPPLAVIGPREALHIAPGAHIEPQVVFDTTRGPVVVEAGASVSAFSRLEGPCHVGPGSQVLGARIRGGVTLGPECRVGGEVECCIFQGLSNKYHDGFLGHAYVGSWVNIGAGTHNSDLRNDYGEVRVVVNSRLERTGRNKVGCFLGDHAKAGLGCLINTGSNFGPFARLLPSGGLLPRHVPAFTGVTEGCLAELPGLDDLLATASTVMARRGKALTPALESLYRAVHADTAGLRQSALAEAEPRPLRLSA
jgi:UDP-N-acetylglucosamine diphosphorylase/glucosamine-1-phosphate N-acetyltransferase